jgi:hypothetical protein
MIGTAPDDAPTPRRPASFAAASIAKAATVEVRVMWEVARGVLLYGWFYYPLYALGEHQLRRVADVAVLYRYQQAVGPPNKKPNPEDGQPTWPSFKRRVDWLIDNGVIAAEKQHRGTQSESCATRPLTRASDILRCP